jgi:hypothetical protein
MRIKRADASGGGGVEAVLLEVGLDVFAGEPLKEVTGEADVFRGFDDDAALDDGWVEERKADEGSHFAELWGAGDGEGNEAGLGVAAGGELRGLGDVFGDDEFGFYLVGDAELGELAGGGEAVRGVEVIGDGDASDLVAGEGVDGERLRGRVLAGPEDEDAVGVGHGLGGVGELAGDELFGVNEVGGEEDIEGGAGFDLLHERGGAAEGGDELDAGGVFVGGGESGQDGLEVGGGGDVELFRGGVLRGRGGGHGEQECGDEGHREGYGGAHFERDGARGATVNWKNA